MGTGIDEGARMVLVATVGSGPDVVVTVTELAGGEPGSADVHLFVVGALGGGECDLVREDLQRLAGTCRWMTVDLSEVTALTAAGIELLTGIQQMLLGTGGSLQLADVSAAASAALAASLG